MSKRPRKAIITCAITGGAHTPTMSPYLPVTPDQIADESIKAAEAGAAIVHLHARRSDGDMYGFPDWRPETYMEFLPRIKQGCDAIVNITTGGAGGMTWEQRLAGPLLAAPEITSFNCGCVNFGRFLGAPKIRDKAKYAWEAKLLESSKVNAYVNTFAMMEEAGQKLGKDRGVRFEFECFDIGHLYAIKTIQDQGWLPEGPLFIQAVLGAPGACQENRNMSFTFMKRRNGFLAAIFRCPTWASAGIRCGWRLSVPRWAVMFGSALKIA